MHRRIAILAAAALAVLLSQPGVSAPPPAFAAATLPEAEFRRLHRTTAPGAERWAEIPWETDLAAARARSAREGRPLLMWVMDGHPLGCT
jgi:hypothetical protein